MTMLTTKQFQLGANLPEDSAPLHVSNASLSHTIARSAAI